MLLQDESSHVSSGILGSLVLAIFFPARVHRTDVANVTNSKKRWRKLGLLNFGVELLEGRRIQLDDVIGDRFR